MRAFVSLAVALATVAASAAAQQPGAPPPGVPTNTYSGYAFAGCGPTDGPILNIVLPAGFAPVPSTLPASPPRPRVELVVQTSLDRAAGQEITIAPGSGSGLRAVALSCPVVGECSSAQSGRLSFQRGADGRLTGEFRARWPDEAARATDIIGRFTAALLRNVAVCG